MTSTAPVEAPPKASRRRTRGWLIAGGVVLALFAALVAVTALLPESPDRMPYSATNPRPEGARALAQVLGRNGVEVVQETKLAEAVAEATAQTTLVVLLSDELSLAAVDELNRVPADLVLLHLYDYELFSIEELTDYRVIADYWWGPEDRAWANCPDDRDAETAGSLTAGYGGFYAYDADVVTCFTSRDEVALYADLRTDQHRVTLIAGDLWFRNDTILDEGNAALALRVFGRHPKLVWYLPGADATSQTGGGEIDPFTLLPPWARAVFAVLLAAGAAAALWRGRRFGALVREPMPVEVPASEVSAGLARLYRQAGARGHAAAGLRAATLHRLAGPLGLPASASSELVVQRLAAATGRAPEYLYGLLYGPPPTTDPELVALATALTDLERKPTRD